MIRVLLVDDQAIVRQGLRSLLSLEPDMTVVGEAADGQEAVDLVRQHEPDLVLMDVRMPRMDGLLALKRVKHVRPRTAVIMVTLYDDPSYLFEAVGAGAAGYILKDASRDELIAAVRTVADGGAIVDAALVPDLLKQMAQLMSAQVVRRLPDDAQPLTNRELEVLHLVGEGYTNQQIADALVVSPTTIKTHVQNILQKLEVSDRTQAAVYAVRHGLI